MHLFNHQSGKTKAIRTIDTTAAFCIVSVLSNLSPALAGVENSSLASMPTANVSSQDQEQNARLLVPIGKWHGHMLNKDENCNLTADLMVKDGELTGTITCNEKHGTSKHYISGSWDAANHTFLLKDVGLDIDHEVSGWYPASFDKYSLRPVDDDNKLVGTCHQTDENKISWVTLVRDQINGSGMAAAPIPGQPPSPFDLSKVASTTPAPAHQHSLRLRSSALTPEGKGYLARIETAVKSHWHPPADSPVRRVSLHFHIHEDGSVSNIKLDPSSTTVDEYVTTSFQAVRDSAPFEMPPKTLLTYPKVGDEQGYVSVHLTLNANTKALKKPA